MIVKSLSIKLKQFDESLPLALPLGIVHWEMSYVKNNRTYVPVICNCQNKIDIMASTVRYAIKEKGYTAGCKNCIFKANFQFIVNELKTRNIQKLDNDVLVLWNELIVGQNLKECKVPIKCICGNLRILGVNQVNHSNNTGFCKHCVLSLDRSPSYKGSTITNSGYKMIHVLCDSPYFPMCARNQRKTHGWCAEHRIIMAQSLNRCLESWEQVHHINGNKLDNRIDNLQLVTPQEHSSVEQLIKENKRLKLKIAQLEKQLAILSF